MRKIARRIAENKKITNKISLKNIKNFLGMPKYSPTLAEKGNDIGVATGMAWTEAGGDILFIEAAVMPGKGKIILTGHLGEVMKESCKAALSYLRSKWKEFKIKNSFDNKDIHVHVPEGAVPKDGPSAGITIATALYSALTDLKVRKDFAMTGEITLRGKILEIGGVKEKVLAAHRAGLKNIILPKENRKDIKEIPANVRKDLKINFVQNLDEVFKLAIATD